MIQIETLHALPPDGEQIVRQRALARGQNAEQSVARVRDALASGRIAAAMLLDRGVSGGIALWRVLPLPGDTQRAHVLVTYTLPGSPLDHGTALVKHVVTTLHALPKLVMIEVRMRDNSPGVREGWAAHNFAFFERCEMIRPLGLVPLPIVAQPQDYTIVPWDASYADAVDRVTVRAHAGGVESVALPEAHSGVLVQRLHTLEKGTLPGVGVWMPNASLVALYKQRSVVGHVALARGKEYAYIVDHAVLPDHRGQGVGRALLLRSLFQCLRYDVPAVRLGLTLRNPARMLYTQLGFQQTLCGEVAVWWHDRRQMKWRD